MVVLKRVLAKPMHGVPGGQRVERAGYLTLVRLEACGQTRLSDLAASLQLDLSTVSRQVKILEELALVRRRPDPDDGRATRLELTEEGRAELEAQRRERHRVLGLALADWSEPDRSTLVTLLGRLADDLTAADVSAASAAPATPATPTSSTREAPSR